jgi:hypothetical protein
MKSQTMRKLRQAHQYLGLFFAPMILLFSFSGALQTFRLQESRDPTITPPTWIVWMASIHKDSSLPRPPKAKPDKSPQDAKTPSGEHDRSARTDLPRHSTLPSKIFAVSLSISLIISTLLGIAIALNNRAARRTSLLLLVGGLIVPLVFLYL